MIKRKLTKVLTSVIAAGTAISLVVPTTILAEDSKKYTVETKNLYAVEDKQEVTKKVDYVTNPNGGPTLGILHNTDGVDGSNQYILAEVDGAYTYAFKDMNKNGKLDTYEDWRKPAEERAASLAKDLASTDEGIKMIAGLMLFSSHERDSAAGLTDKQKEYLDGSYVRNITDAAGNDVKDSVGWVNAMQAHIEESAFNVPVDFSSDPRSTAGSGDLYSAEAANSDISSWPSNIGMAATFDVDHMYKFAQATSAEYRALGIVTALGPQIDLATEPRWLRVGGTFGENVDLATDMAQAYVDGSQSTYASDGTDMGWGKDSINCMIKHFPGDGAGEGGREAHTDAGKYAVYPGNNFAEHLVPFAEGGLQLQGKTKSATAVMTSYSIGIDGKGNALGGEAVGSAYSQYKMDILREDLGFDGVVCTDWGVTSEATTGFGMAWGMEGTSKAEKHYAILKAGTDMFGGNNDGQPIVDAFAMFVADIGEEAARARYADSARRLLLLTMQPGLFENPYLDLQTSLAEAGSADKVTNGYQAQLDSVVMLKNKDKVIQGAETMEKAEKDMKVYIPMTHTEEQRSLWGTEAAAWSESLNLTTAKNIYGEVITDEQQADGSYKAPDLTGVDKVIIGIRSPMNGGLFSNIGQIKNEDGTKSYYPLSLQYGEYVADGANVRKESMAGDAGENRSYYGVTSKVLNPYDLTVILNSADAVAATGQDIPIVVAMNASGPAIVSEFEDKVDAIVVGFSVSDQAIFDVINGRHQPTGLLPLQFPANMDTVEAQAEDIGQDMVCYKDAEGNTYDVAYGLNWSGIIDDERVATYNPNRPTTEVGKIEDNKAPEVPETKETPTPTKTTPTKTGDATNTSGYGIAMIVSLGLVMIGVMAHKKRKIKE